MERVTAVGGAVVNCQAQRVYIAPKDIQAREEGQEMQVLVVNHW